MSSGVMSAIGASCTTAPSRITVTVSQTAKISSRRCEMNSTAAPCPCRVRTTANSRSTSGPESAAVGSSMIRTWASKLSALAISTICWSAIDRPRTGRSDAQLDPEPVEQALHLAVHRAAIDAVERPARVVAHDDVLRDAEIGEQRRLLVDDRDARVAGVVRGVEVDALAAGEHLAGVAPDHAAEHLHERRLAGAVLADQAAHLAGPQDQVAVLQRADRAVGLRRVPQLDDGGDGRSLRPRLVVIEVVHLSSDSTINAHNRSRKRRRTHGGGLRLGGRRLRRAGTASARSRRPRPRGARRPR